MSKDHGFLENAAQPAFVPSAPPSYDEAMQQAGSAYPSLPMAGPMAGPYTAQPQHMQMPMPMPQTAPHAMPMTNYAAPLPVVQPVAPQVQASAAPPTIVYTSLGRDRSYTVCHKCNAQILTETHEKNKCSAHVCCCILMFVFPCCCCLPYCMDSCKVVKHTCPSCGTKLGTYGG